MIFRVWLLEIFGQTPFSSLQKMSTDYCDTLFFSSQLLSASTKLKYSYVCQPITRLSHPEELRVRIEVVTADRHAALHLKLGK
jgi:hypothetical protein